MAEISADTVKKLRDTTNVSMMECKRALVEANGDMEKATRILRERGIAIATKKASRATNQGIIASATTPDGKISSLIQVNCETDFVARNDNFKTFVSQLAVKACSTDGNLGETMKSDLTAKVVEIGENLVITRNMRFVLQGTGAIASYIHMGGKVGVLVDVSCEKAETVNNPIFKELIKDLTLHVAASKPRYLTSAEVPADVVKTEREIYAKQVTNKPANIIDKIVDGKMKKFYEENCFVNQLFVKEQKVTITALLDAKGKQVNDILKIRKFARYQLGE
ncbi:MAG: translation elongation factor Ts [Kiritimatiellae bacterium]|nr:translation elongation factor Ts [Kiritimatiellia bacterium]MDD5521671.1 translation elongation factor Ts [Kiritimatiellia bacterium]